MNEDHLMDGEVERPSWRSTEEWNSSAEVSAAEAERKLSAATDRWRAAFGSLGEISEADWREFRPLRLEREESWSDWLAHLLATSPTGVFAKRLLGRSESLHGVEGYANLKVAREVRTKGGERRADLVVEWADAVAHIEVKTGDRCFGKTVQTCHLLEQSYGRGRRWADFILVPPADLDLWLDENEGSRATRPIAAITWFDVASALRHAARDTADGERWRWMAHAFCGAAEQRILGCETERVRLTTVSPVRRLALASVQLKVMEDAET